MALGAFGAHGLRARLGAGGIEIWKTAALYHLVHAAALLALALAGERVRGGRAICTLFALLAGWLSLAVTAWGRRRS